MYILLDCREYLVNVNLLRSFVFFFQLTAIKEAVSKMTGSDTAEVRVVVAPYRICPLGAHIDHQVGRFCV